MQNFISAFRQLSEDKEKYDAIYVNTPWNRLSTEKMSRLDIKSIMNDDSLLYIWADTFTMSDAIHLIEKYGYKFKSVFQVFDIATYPSEIDSKCVSKTQNEEPNCEEDVEKVEKNKIVKRSKKKRCPPLNLPNYWVNSDFGGSRPTTEYLLMATRGSDEACNLLIQSKSGTLPYQVINKPECGKKSRSVCKENINLDPTWVVDRPYGFLDTVLYHLKTSTRVIELFGSSIRDNVDSLGPIVPGGFCPGYSKNYGISCSLNKVMRTMRKIQLQVLSSVLLKMGQTKDLEQNRTEFKKIGDIWSTIIKSLSDMKSDILYDWGSDDPDLPVEWLRLLVIFFAKKNISDFSIMRKRKKKRKTSSNFNRQCHGIAKPMIVSNILSEFLGLDEDTKVSRTHTVKLLNKYVKDKNLQNPENRIEIIPDVALNKVLNPPADFGPITYFKMCSLLGPHFPSSKSAVVENSPKKHRIE
jgi:chromatin remodeling complex protein RSC6